eukprot:gene2015-3018_t
MAQPYVPNDVCERDAGFYGMPTAIGLEQWNIAIETVGSLAAALPEANVFFASILATSGKVRDGLAAACAERLNAAIPGPLADNSNFHYVPLHENTFTA